MIEVERLASISEAEYRELGEKILALGGKDLGRSDTESVFFLNDSGRQKVQRRPEQGTAKIVWKSGASLSGEAERREIELPIAPEHFETAVELFDAMLPPHKTFRTDQKRHDYSLDGVEIAVKHSEDYGFHLEFDQTVPDYSDLPTAQKAIELVAEKLGVHAMDADEARAFLAEMVRRREARDHAA